MTGRFPCLAWDCHFPIELQVLSYNGKKGSKGHYTQSILHKRDVFLAWALTNQPPTMFLFTPVPNQLPAPAQTHT